MCIDTKIYVHTIPNKGKFLPVFDKQGVRGLKKVLGTVLFASASAPRLRFQTCFMNSAVA